jgi:hypothetical protein
LTPSLKVPLSSFVDDVSAISVLGACRWRPVPASGPEGLERPSIRAGHSGPSTGSSVRPAATRGMAVGKVAPSNERLCSLARRYSERLPPASSSAPNWNSFRETASMKLCHLEPNSVWDHAELQESPHLNEQLPGQGHNPHLASARPPRPKQVWYHRLSRLRGWYGRQPQASSMATAWKCRLPALLISCSPRLFSPLWSGGDVSPAAAPVLAFRTAASRRTRSQRFGLSRVTHCA